MLSSALGPCFLCRRRGPPSFNYVAIRAWLLLKHEMDINVTSKDFSARVVRRHVDLRIGLF